MIHTIKELLQIKVNDVSVALFDEALCVNNRIVLTPFRPKPKTEVGELRFPDVIEHLCNRLLDHTIYHSWNTQQSYTPVGFRNVFATNG